MTLRQGSILLGAESLRQATQNPTHSSIELLELFLGDESEADSADEAARRRENRRTRVESTLWPAGCVDEALHMEWPFRVCCVLLNVASIACIIAVLGADQWSVVRLLDTEECEAQYEFGLYRFYAAGACYGDTRLVYGDYDSCNQAFCVDLYYPGFVLLGFLNLVMVLLVSLALSSLTSVCCSDAVFFYSKMKWRLLAFVQLVLLITPCVWAHLHRSVLIPSFGDKARPDGVVFGESFVKSIFPIMFNIMALCIYSYKCP